MQTSVARRAGVAAIMSLSLALAACSSSAPTSTSSSTGAASGAEIVIKDFKYTVPASVHPGEKVMVRNDDSVGHTVTSDTGKTFDVPVQGHATATLTVPSTAGTYKFHCTYHPYMHGSLKVS